jgi:hypothetical protein
MVKGLLSVMISYQRRYRAQPLNARYELERSTRDFNLFRNAAGNNYNLHLGLKVGKYVWKRYHSQK